MGGVLAGIMLNFTGDNYPAMFLTTRVVGLGVALSITRNKAMKKMVKDWQWYVLKPTEAAGALYQERPTDHLITSVMVPPHHPACRVAYCLA